MNITLFCLIVILPVCVFIASSFAKYSREVTGTDRLLEMVDFWSDVGLDFYFIGLIALISVIITIYGQEIPAMSLVYVVIYLMGGFIVGTLYQHGSSDPFRNLCFLVGLMLGLIPLMYAAYITLIIL